MIPSGLTTAHIPQLEAKIQRVEAEGGSDPALPKMRDILAGLKAQARDERALVDLRQTDAARLARADPAKLSTHDRMKLREYQREGLTDPDSGAPARGIGDVLPKLAKIAAGPFRRERPKLWAIEARRCTVKTFSYFDWLSAAERAAKRAAETPDGCTVTVPFRLSIIRVFADAFREWKGCIKPEGTGVGTHKWFAARAGTNRETVRQLIIWLESIGLIDVWNRTDRPTEGRLKGLVVRIANLYLPLLPNDDRAPAPATAAPEPVAGPGPATLAQACMAHAAHVARQIDRGTRVFRLFGRKLGLNLSPLRPMLS